jgi:hypothetical protein
LTCGPGVDSFAGVVAVGQPNGGGVLKKLMFLLPFALIFFIGPGYTRMGLFAVPGSSDRDRPLPDFPYSQGWLGADDAYSIALGRDRSLWLFGDTFVADRGTKLRSQYKVMVRNSVGISTCPVGGHCTINYFWQNPYTAKPRSFFDSGTDDLWYWPLDGFLNGKTLFVSLLAVRNKPKANPGDAFGFEIAGTKLATVRNALDPPRKWKVSIQELTDSRFWPGTSMIADENRVLWYTQVSKGEGKGFMTVLRVPKDKMGTPSAAWEYLKQNGGWGPGLPGDDAMHVIEQPISEMSVRYHSDIRKWIAVVPGPGFPTPQVDVRKADSPIGPWSDPQKLFEFPEMISDRSGYEKDTFCYATKEHVEFTDTKIALTYTCNSMVVSKTVANMDIYRPRVVILDIPR